MLTRVTVTGADDDVDPTELRALSMEFPFVEWGILFSRTRFGTPRYPCTSWIQSFAQVARASSMALAAHFCGQCARDTLAGDECGLKALFGGVFQRVQLNGFVAAAAEPLIRIAPKHSVEFILQARVEEEIQDAVHAAARMPRASILFDPSSGQGIEAFRWPVAPLGVRMGYAGGIKPSTVVDVLRDIGPVDGDFWIDMESGVRDEHGSFDLQRVRAVLEAARPWVQMPGGAR